jgi:hypothetical protein
LIEEVFTRGVLLRIEVVDEPRCRKDPVHVALVREAQNLLWFGRNEFC